MTNTRSEIEASCTVKRADVLAVISELVVVMKQALQDSKRVKLDGFGSFKLGLSTSPSDTAKGFTAAKNVKDIHVLFQPEVRIDKSAHRQERTPLALVHRRMQGGRAARECRCRRRGDRCHR